MSGDIRNNADALTSLNRQFVRNVGRHRIGNSVLRDGVSRIWRAFRGSNRTAPGLRGSAPPRCFVEKSAISSGLARLAPSAQSGSLWTRRSDPGAQPPPAAYLHRWRARPIAEATTTTADKALPHARHGDWQGDRRAALSAPAQGNTEASLPASTPRCALGSTSRSAHSWYVTPPRSARSRLARLESSSVASTRRASSTVLFVSLSGWLAGPGRSLSTLISHLPRNIEVVLASPPGGDLLPAVESTHRLRAHVPLPRQGQEPDGFSRLRAIVILSTWMARHRRDILAVHVNGFSELHVTAPGAVLTRLPLVVWFLGHEENPWDSRLGWLWGRLVRFNALVAISDIARRRAVASKVAPASAIEIIPTPIDPSDVTRSHPSRTRVASRPIVVGFFGSTTLHKGLARLPELIRRVGPGNVQWLVFSGAPDSREAPVMQDSWEELRRFDPSWVSVPGYAKDVRDAFAACDVVLTMSTAEAFGRTVAEAMLNGIPVVATDIEAHRALLGDNEAGILFPSEDIGAAANAIRSLAEDPLLRERLSAAGRTRAASFRPGPIAARFMALYSKGT